MIRWCDGSDPNLTAADGTGGCACGLLFDDVEIMVCWPHNPVGPKLTLAELEALAAALGIKPGAGQVIGRAAEDSIQDPFTGQITVRIILGEQ